MPKKNNPFYYYFTVPFIVAFIIFYLSCLINPSSLPQVDIEFEVPIDKMVHFCMYFGLSLVIALNYILVNKGRVVILRVFIFAVILPILYGGIIEILQDRYFNRTGDWEDFLANALGVLCSLPFTFYVRKVLLSRERKI